MANKHYYDLETLNDFGCDNSFWDTKETTTFEDFHMDLEDCMYSVDLEVGVDSEDSLVIKVKYMGLWDEEAGEYMDVDLDSEPGKYEPIILKNYGVELNEMWDDFKFMGY